MRTTVSIPLHASARWYDVICGNLDRLAGVARVVVSDPTGLDDTWERLRTRFAGRPDIVWRGACSIPTGWVAHCNALLEETETEFAMWLPHDDEVTAAWITEAETALTDRPRCALACGHIVAMSGSGESSPERIDPDPRFADEDVSARLDAVLSSVGEAAHGSVGVLFRSVVRSDRAVALPQIDSRGTWADQLWAVTMLARGPVAITDATYRKRWHPDSVHASWTSLAEDHALRSRHLPEALTLAADPATTLPAMGRAWQRELADSAARHRDHETAALAHQGVEHAAAVADLQADHAAALAREQQKRSAGTAKLRAEHAARIASIRREHRRALAQCEDAFRTSRSWRVTAPMRRLSRWWKRLRAT